MVYRVAMLTAYCFVILTSFVSASQSCPIGYAGSPCKDIQPPMLECPDNLLTDTSKGKPTSSIVWSVQVTDNSVDADPNALIQVRSSHESGQELPLGQTLIKVTAKDKVGNEATCHFTVEVKDQEPPVFTYCPDDITINDITMDLIRVTWDWPEAVDNSGELPTFYSNRHPGEMFSVPGTHEVQAKAVDAAGNEATCNFRIILKVKTCKSYAAPINGALACFKAAWHQTCVAMCKSGFDFASYPGMVYLCGSGQWFAFPYGTPPPWPDCSVRGSYPRMNPNYYFNGEANDPSVQSAIRKNFISLMNNMPHQFCMDNQQCTEDNVTVNAGASTA
ncbi:hypothetical protein ACROYT_G019938 [Oculina patagonica]